jgi:hypothetical protein
MTDEDSDAKVRASELARELSTNMQLEVSEADLAVIAEAFEQDLMTPCQRKDDEDRLEKVETQTQLLAEAVIAITRIEETLAPAVQAVKDEMRAPRAIDWKPDSPKQ